MSPATVSRSLRGVSKVAPITRQRVLDAARELSYSPAAHGLGPHHTVAVIVPFISRWFFSTVTAAAVDLLRERGYDALLYHLGSAGVRDRFFDRMPLAGRVDGILTLSMPLTDRHTLALRALDIPLVSVGSSIPAAPSVGIDEAGIADAAVNHLLHLGHERLGLLTGTADDPGFAFRSSAQRRLGCERALAGAGLALDDALVATGPHGMQGGAAAMSDLLGRKLLPTAVLAEYDELAIGALWAIRRAGLRVPEDISVIGIDDHELSAAFDLTTMAQSAREQGELGAEMLLEVLREANTAAVADPIVLPTQLVLRGTTARAPVPGRRSTLR